MSTLSHPFRLVAGHAALLEPGSAEHASQLAGHVLATELGERPLAPLLGLRDPAGSVVDSNRVYSALNTGAPELVAQSVNVSAGPDGYVDVAVTVEWGEE